MLWQIKTYDHFDSTSKFDTKINFLKPWILSETGFTKRSYIGREPRRKKEKIVIVASKNNSII